MNDEIIAMAREAGGLGYVHDAGDDPHKWQFTPTELQAFTAIVRDAGRNKLASWLMAQGYATGHGDTMEQLLEELDREIGFDRAELWLKRINEAVLAEREACAKVADKWAEGRELNYSERIADEIRARGQAS
jgi:hypothetical protein